MPRFFVVLGCSAVLVAGASGIAAAADLPSPPAYMPVTPVFQWTGFYIGGNAGYGWTHASGTLTTAAGADPFTASANGFLGGAQLGYNWQIASIVFGAEADFQGSFESGTLSALAGPVVSATAKNPWFGTVRGRVGYAMDRILFYATGGAVYGDSTLNGTVSTVGPFSSSATFWTWTAGAGIEAAFWGCWSAKFEYLYVGTPTTIPPIPTVTSVSGSANTNIVRVGINYHF